MFCPRCGQEQAANNLRFCSRCGLPLGIISEVIANGGTLPQLLELEKKPFLSRRNGAIFSLFWFIFFVLILTPFWGIVGIDELAGVSAITGIFGGLMILLFSLLVLKKPRTDYQTFPTQDNFTPSFLHGSQQQNVLPPQQTQPAQDYVSPANSWKAPDTDDLVRRGSVTEGTTKLLSKDE
jgi:hypothetical protein